jgi:integrase
MSSVKITERLATTLKWIGKPTFHWDTELKGFGVWVWGEHSRAYVVQAKRDGRSYRKTLGKVGEITQEKAREAATAFKGTVKAGRDPNAEEKAERGAWTLQDAMDHFLGAYATARRLAPAYRTDCDALFKHHTPDKWKSMKLADVSQSMIVARHGAITGGVTIKDSEARGGTRRANAWLTLMSRLFTLGLASGHCTINPTTGIKKNDEVHRERYLSEREIGTLWQYLDKHHNIEAAVCVQFVLLTGCRPGEAYTMRWADLDKTSGVWKKPAAKTKQRKAHTIRLTARALAVLNRLDTWKRSEYVFPSPEDASQPRQDKLKAFWRATRKNCGLPDVRFYDCRHSFASWLAMGGASELEIAAQLGHANIQTTKRYVHLAQEHLRTKAGIMGDVIEKALANHPLDQQPIVAELKKGGRIVQHLSDMEVTPDTFALPVPGAAKIEPPGK